MQTKKHSSKFKTLTLTLAVASVINTNTVFADAAADATAIETMGTALKDFIKDYSYTTLVSLLRFTYTIK